MPLLTKDFDAGEKTIPKGAEIVGGEWIDETRVKIWYTPAPDAAVLKTPVTVDFGRLEKYINQKLPTKKQWGVANDPKFASARRQIMEKKKRILYRKALAVLNRKVRGATMSSSVAKKIAEAVWKEWVSSWKGGLKWFLAAMEEVVGGMARRDPSLLALDRHIGLDAKRLGRGPLVSVLTPIIRGQRTPEMKEKVVKALTAVLPKLVETLEG